MTGNVLENLALSTASTVVVIAANLDPQTSDIICVVGAALATAVVTSYVRERKRRSIGEFITITLSCSVVGSIAPGAILYTWWPLVAMELSWHGWAALGFLAGLIGWFLVEAILKVAGNKTETAVKHLLNKYIPPETKDQDRDNE